VSALPAGFAEGKRLWSLLAGSGFAVAAALGVRGYLHHRTLRAAAEQADAALARDTFGGFREADQTLATLVPTGSSEGPLLALRAYALAQIAARYSDDQAAVEADLLLMPLERQGPPWPRLYAARALLLLAGGEPGSALTVLGRAPEGSREISVLKARIAIALDRPDLAEAAVTEALSGADPPVDALYTAATLAAQGRQYRKALDLYQQALTRSPRHVPSLVAIADLSVSGHYKDPAKARDLLNRSLGGLSSEASPGEMCQIYLDLAQLDLMLGLIAEAPEMLDRAAEIEDTPSSCRLPLARLNQRVGRRKAALEILEKAAADDETGEVTLALVQSLSDWQKALDWLDHPPPPELASTQLAIWSKHAHALKLSALSALGRRPQAAPLLDELTGEEFIDALIGVARYHAFLGDAPEIQRLLAQAKTRASQSGSLAPDELARIGEVALSLRAYQVAVSACAESAQQAPANYRALVCIARGLAGEGRGREAIASLDRALALSPDSSEALSLKSSLALATPQGNGRR
jgi:tetratricopeptide (TPR) repeat protein